MSLFIGLGLVRVYYSSRLPNSYHTYLWYFLSVRFEGFFRQIHNQITYLWQSKWQRVQVHSSMNTASKASNLFEAFFGIHEMPSLQNWAKVKKLHEQRFKFNIGMNILSPVSNWHYFTITITQIDKVQQKLQFKPTNYHFRL